MKSTDVREMKSPLFAERKSIQDLQDEISRLASGEVAATCHTILGMAVNTTLEAVAKQMDDEHEDNKWREQ